MFFRKEASVFSLLSLFHIHFVVNGWILRLPCESEANFDIISTNYSLVYNVIGKFTVSTKEECFERCIQMSLCKSLNHKDKGNENCELSNETNGTVGAANLQKRDGWTYYTTDYSEKNIGAYCKIEKPCGGQQYCVDACTCPGYRCIPCGDGYFLNGDFKCNEIKECASNPCLNGGVCNDLIGKFSCQCQNGYTGIRCETECKTTTLGSEYRGLLAQTETGRRCQRWDSQSPHEHGYTKDVLPFAGLEENYCRNPSEDPPGPWCYTVDPASRWEYCNVPLC